MHKTYVYRKHIHSMAKWFPWISIILSAMMIILGIFVDYALIAIGVIFLLYDAFFFVFLKRLASTAIELTDDALIYSTSATSVTLRYEDIAKIDSRSVNYGGGWMLIKPVTGKPIRLTVVLENIADMILTLKERFISLNLTDRYDDKKLFRFYKTAMYSDQSWVRSRFFMKRFMITLALFVPITIVLGVFVFDGILWMLLMMIVGIVPYLYIEFEIYASAIKHLEYDSDWTMEAPDPFLEKKRLNLAYYLFLASLAVGILLQFLL